MLWLPGVLVLLCGLPALLRTGQVDPRGWALPALLLIPVAAWFKIYRSEGAAFWTGLGAFGAVLCCAFLATWRLPALAPLSALFAMVLLSILAGLRFAAARPFQGGGFVLIALAVWWLGKEPRLAPLLEKPPVMAVISGLPLFWQEGETGPAARMDAPIITVLRQRFAVVPLDSPQDLRETKLLLLAQPRAFSMEEVVALDEWTRGGGMAVVLADPRLRWPLNLPLGDRRRPPVVSHLAGLLELWGVKLLPPNEAGEVRHFLPDGRLLTLYAASGFEKAGSGCRILGRGRIARCRVGRGEATIIADADLIDDRLWLADPTDPLDPARWTADTPQFLVKALGGALAADHRWARTGEALMMGVRWALLVGFFWAALGTALFNGKGHALPTLTGPGRIAKNENGSD